MSVRRVNFAVRAGFRLRGVCAALAAAVAVLAAGAAETIVCGETGAYHLQGVAADDAAIYWSFTTKIVKTDLTGAVLGSIAVPTHSGDLTVHRGEVYVATEDRSKSPSSNEVRVYDAATLALRRTYSLDAVFKANGRDHYSSNIAYANGYLWMAIGTASTSTSITNGVYQFTPSFDFVRLYEMETGNSQYGTQTLEWTGEQWVFGYYAGHDGVEPRLPSGTLFVPPDFSAFTVCTAFGCSEGVFMLNGRLWTAASAQQKDGTYKATATCRTGYTALPCVAGADGSMSSTPADLVADFGFAPQTLFRGRADGTIAAPPADTDALLVNAVAYGGCSFALDLAAGALAHGVYVPSGRLVVPDPAVFAPSDEPIVLAESTLAFTGGGDLRRDVVLRPNPGYEKSAAVIDVAAGKNVSLFGRIGGVDGVGNLVKRGAGTFTLATYENSVTNYLGYWTTNASYSSALSNFAQYPANGDGPSPTVGSFLLTDGTVKIATDPTVTTLIGGNDSEIGCRTTTNGLETTGHLEIHSGKVEARNWLALGYLNGTAETAPSGPLVPTIDVYGGSLSVPALDLGYCGYEGVPYTTDPVVTVHKGGTLNVTDRLRLDMARSRGTINVDGGTCEINNLSNNYYNYPGSSLTVNVTNGGVFRVTGTCCFSHSTSAVSPSFARLSVTDGGTFEAGNVTAASPSDVAFYFDGATFKTRNNGSSDAYGVAAEVVTTIGPRGLRYDVSSTTPWGLRWMGPISSAPGAASGGMTVYTSASEALGARFEAPISLVDGISVTNAIVMFGDDVVGGVTFNGEKAGIRAIKKDVTIDRVVFNNRRARFDVAFNGMSDKATTAHMLTVNEIVPPAYGFFVYFWSENGTTAVLPTGKFAFLRVPASSSLHVDKFMEGHVSPRTFRNDNKDWVTKYYVITESEAEGWRTFYVESSLTAPEAPPAAIDPREGDWLAAGAGTWKIGPWLFDCGTGAATCANPFVGEKQNWESGGIAVSDALTLTGGGKVSSSTFVKAGPGTLTLAGDNRTYEFGTSYIATDATLATFPGAWNLFDADGHSATSVVSAVTVAAGTLQIGTGSDSPLVYLPSSSHVTVGTGTTSAEGAEQDAFLRMESGEIFSPAGAAEIRIGYNHGTAATAAHSPLLAGFEMNGGHVKVPIVRVGFNGVAGAVQTNYFTLNGGHCEATKNLYVGSGDANGSGEVCAKFTMNGGLLEVGRGNWETGSPDSSRLAVAEHNGKTPGLTSVFEMNGGVARLYGGLAIYAAKDAAHASHVHLNGGVIELGNKSKFTGGSHSTLHFNGGVIRPFRSVSATANENVLQGVATVVVEEGGAIFDLSTMDADYLAIHKDVAFTGTGDMVVRGGDTNRCVRIHKAMPATIRGVAEKGGVIQQWGSNLFGTVLVRDGGGYSSYYSGPVKNLTFGETATDVTCSYGYGYSDANAIIATDSLSIKGTVYVACRICGSGNELRLPQVNGLEVLRGPKGCFADVDVAAQIKLHPALAAAGVQASFRLVTSNIAYDQILADVSRGGAAHPSNFNLGYYPARYVINEPLTLSGTVKAAALEKESRRSPSSSNAGTVEVNAPFRGSGTLQLTSGRIEGRPEFFNGITLDLNNASVRFTESGVTTANLKSTYDNNNVKSIGIGLEVPEGKTVVVEGTLANKSALVKKDPGTIVLRGGKATDKVNLALVNKGNPGTNAAYVVPENGDVPDCSAALTVLGGKLVLDMPGTVTNGAYGYVGPHPISDGRGGAQPAVLEQWRGTFYSLGDNLCIGRSSHKAAGGSDDYSVFTERPYVAYNLHGGRMIVNGVILGYSNYAMLQWGLFELNVTGGELEVQKGRFAICHEGSNVMRDGLYKEGVVNLYGGVIRKPSSGGSDAGGIQVGGYDGSACTHFSRGTLNVYGGEFLCGADVPVCVPYTKGMGWVNLYGGVLQAKNIVRKNTVAGTAGYVKFDGGTFRPLEADASLSGLTAVTVGAAGGTIEVASGATYTVAQAIGRAEDLAADAPDGGIAAGGAGTLVLGAENAFTGPVGAKTGATVKQGVAGAFSDEIALAGGTADLNGIATTLRALRGRGTVRGDVTVTDLLELDGTLTVNGNLALGAGAVVRMRLADDGSSAGDCLRVTGALACAGSTTFDFGRVYDDVLIPRAYNVEIGQAGSVSGLNAAIANAGEGTRFVAKVSVGNDGRLFVSAAKKCLVIMLR